MQTSSSSSSRGFNSHSPSPESGLNDDDLCLPLRKRQKYQCSYQSSWESEEKFATWIRKSKKRRDYAFCTFWAKEIKISGGGANDLSRHRETTLHRRSSEAVATTPNIATVLAATNTLATKVIKSEVLFASFIAEHNVPMNVSEHARKLFKAMFPDSDIAKRFASGRTKTTEIIKGALSPYYTKPVIEAMCKGPFSLLMDETTDNTAEKEAVLLSIFFAENLGRVVCNILFLSAILLQDKHFLSLWRMHLPKIACFLAI